MSAFGDWWVKARNEVEATVEQIALALEPSVKAALVQAAQAGAAAAMATTGTAGDRFVAARNAAEAILKSQGQTIGESLLQASVTQALADLSAPAPAPAAPAP